MANAEFHEVLPIDQKRLFDVIVRYEDYPEFVDGCRKVKVSRPDGKKVRVVYHVNVLSKDFTYTLDHFEDSKTGKVEWTLIESDLFKKNIGRWEIRSVGPGKTDVLYTIDVEFKIPVPGFILNRLVKTSLPVLVKNFEKKASA